MNHANVLIIFAVIYLVISFIAFLSALCYWLGLKKGMCIRASKNSNEKINRKNDKKV